jgi:hypothetical protein
MRHVIDSPTDFLVDSPSASKNNDAWASYGTFCSFSLLFSSAFVFSFCFVYSVPYPVQNSIPYFPKELKKRCLDDLPCQQKQKTDGNSGGKGVIEECEDFDTFSLRIFGETLQRIFIRPYNEKVLTAILHT